MPFLCRFFVLTITRSVMSICSKEYRTMAGMRGRRSIADKSSAYDAKGPMEARIYICNGMPGQLPLAGLSCCPPFGIG